MTDTEIIKALECCLDAVDEGDTKTFDFLNEVIDLINRQRAQIEGLKKELTEYKLRLKMSERTVDEIKSEAIKEFIGVMKSDI